MQYSQKRNVFQTKLVTFKLKSRPHSTEIMTTCYRGYDRTLSLSMQTQTWGKEEAPECAQREASDQVVAVRQTWRPYERKGITKVVTSRRA